MLKILNKLRIKDRLIRAFVMVSVIASVSGVIACIAMTVIASR